MDSWLGRPAGRWAGDAESCKRTTTTRSALWQDTFSTLMPVCENADALKIVVVNLKGLAYYCGETRFILKAKRRILS